MVKLSSGVEMPVFGLGTWMALEGDVTESVTTALKQGYRMIDTADVYCNHVAVGLGIANALKAGYIKDRSEVFVTSKVWCCDFGMSKVKPAVELILSELGLEYLDQVLLHWPTPLKVVGKAYEFDASVNLAETWKVLEELVAAGKIKTLGVSNFTKVDLDAFLPKIIIKPDVNQVECHPAFHQNELREFMKPLGIALVAYCPIGGMTMADFKSPMDNATIKTIAEKIRKTPAQVCLAWGLEVGNIIIPKSVKEDRLLQNLGSLDIKLSEEDMKTIAAIPQTRKLNPKWRSGGQAVFSDTAGVEVGPLLDVPHWKWF